MKSLSWLLLLCIFVAFPTVETAYKDENVKNNARPFYNIAHMVNNRKQLDAWLNLGANAVENDVSFAVDGTPNYFYHGIPCDAFRICSRWDYIKPYIEAVRARTEPGSSKFNPKFTLLLFDLKVRKLDQHVLARAGSQFTDKVLIPLFNNTSVGLKAVLSVLDSRKTDIIQSIAKRLNETHPEILSKVGFDVENLAAVDQECRQRIPAGHIWLSAGASNWFIPFMQWIIKGKLAKLVALRDNDGSKTSKVYTWTVDDKWIMKNYLKTGLDGIITNHPQNVNKALEEFNEKSKEMKYRLATLNDDPFRRSRVEDGLNNEY